MAGGKNLADAACCRGNQSSVSHASEILRLGGTVVTVPPCSNLSEEQAQLITEFETAAFILDPDEAGQKLKKQVLANLLSAMPVRIIEPKKQVDLMTGEELQMTLGPKLS
jgi:hypothetical protein